jgi:glycerol-3-phosphate acyltransferase PlsX
MKIAIDVMGGDYAPEEIVKGSISSLKERNLEIILLGEEKRIYEELKKYNFKNNNLSITNCKDTITAGEFPLSALRTKKESSILVGIDLLKTGEADAFISAGNSGAVMAAALLKLGCISKIHRPAIVTVLPAIKGKVVILDVGANVDCKPEHLLQFAFIGSKYAKYLLNIKDPKIGLLNIGEEESKGNKFAQSAYKIMNNANINFIGNIEGKDVFEGVVDVVVCDGFTGNVLLKFSEGLVKMLLMEINEKVISQLPQNQEMDQLKQKFMELVKRTDYTEYGGLPLLGVNGLCFICHGRSKSKAITNAIINASKFVDSNILEHLKET